MPFTRPFMQALDMVMAEETVNAGEVESDTEIDETEYMQDVRPGSAAPIATSSPATAPRVWYAVVRGTRVGVFNDM